MGTTYMTDKERNDLRTVLEGIDTLSQADKTITLGIMIGMRLAEVNKKTVNDALKGV